jgi:hypothetical protein
LKPTFTHKILIAATLMVAALFHCQPAGAKDFSVKVTRGRLSVKADKAIFGSLMDRIAKDAGFELSISPDIAAKTLSTEFMDLDLERGIQRLMGLIRHRNFFMFYGRDGNIKKIEIYGARKGSSGPAVKPPSHPDVPGQRMVPMIMEPPPGSKLDRSSNRGKKDIKGAPYIPPASMPEYIPPRRGIGGGK